MSIISITFDTMSPLAKDDILESSTVRPHLMVNGQLYWLSAFPSDDDHPSNLIYIGKVEKEVSDTPTKDLQAYRISMGTKIYSDGEHSYVVYLNNSNSLHRYATTEASENLLYYNGTVYVSLSSLCSWDYENYVNNYEPFYGEQIAADQIPEDAIYIGDTNFVGYNMLVNDDFESNTFQIPESIYQDHRDPELLYVGDSNIIYVPLR